VASSLRALDAIHLATALTIKGDLAAFCCYDRRLSEAASGAGLTVIAPGS
jgi:predicted nucleic acid-binding protein